MPQMSNVTLESLTKCDPDFIIPNGFDENDKKTRDKCLYLKQLLADKNIISRMPGTFLHMERLLDDEIVKVRSVLFQNNNRPLELPSPSGKTVTLSKKVFVPAKDYPDYNFVGRILGPRGLTAKQLEQETGCKIMVRGKGSMRDKKKEEQNRGRPNWEHLNEELHVLITVEDSENRAEIKLQRAIAEIEKLLIPAIEGEDDLKKKQLMELAIINGTYRDNSNGQKQNGMTGTKLAAIPANIAFPLQNGQFRLPNIVPTGMPGLMNASVLRNPNMTMTQAGMTQMDQQLYYAHAPSIDVTQAYPYTTITPGLMNGMDTYVSQNVSPHEGSTGTSPGSSNPGSNAQPQLVQPMGGLKSVSMSHHHHSARMNRVQQNGHPYARPSQGTVPSCRPLGGAPSVISNFT